MLIRYYATLDASGFPTAFYNDDVSQTIPTGAVEITEDQWQDFIQNTGLRKWDATTSAVVEYAPPAVVVVPTVSGDAVLSALSDAQAAKARILDLARVAANSSIPVSNPKLGRIAIAAGMTAQALFTAAVTG